MAISITKILYSKIKFCKDYDYIASIKEFTQTLLNKSNADKKVKE
jgi:hypothetical protein